MKLPIEKERLPIKQLLIYGFLPSFLKKIIYRIKGYKIGPNVKIGFGSILIGEKVKINVNVSMGFLSIIKAKHIEIGAYSSIASFCYFDTEYLKIGYDTRIREQVYAGGMKTPQSKLMIGDRCLIAVMTSFNPTLPIIIGDDTCIGGHSLLFTHSSWLSKLDGFPVKFGPIKIGNNVWGSWRLFINAGVEIGDNVILQPNSVISKNIPPNSIYFSNPVKIVPNFIYTTKSIEQQKQIIKEILDSFIEFLEYKEIKLSIENDLFSFIIDNNKYKIIVQYEENIKLSQDYNNIIITFLKSNKLKELISDNDMVLSILEKHRIGSNLLGEELIKYFSRYGIRFKRY